MRERQLDLLDALALGEGGDLAAEPHAGAAALLVHHLHVGPAHPGHQPRPERLQDGLLRREARRHVSVALPARAAVVDLRSREEALLDSFVLPDQPLNARHLDDVDPDADPEAGYFHLAPAGGAARRLLTYPLADAGRSPASLARPVKTASPSAWGTSGAFSQGLTGSS